MYGNIKNSEYFLIYFIEKLGNIEVLKKIFIWYFLEFNFKIYLFYF